MPVPGRERVPQMERGRTRDTSRHPVAPGRGHHAAAGAYWVPAAFWGGAKEISEASSVTMPIMLITAMW
jgi:hypothetical protein